MRHLSLFGVLALSCACGLTEPASVPILVPQASITFQPGPEFPVIDGSAGVRTSIWIAQPKENPGNPPTPHDIRIVGLCACGPNGEYTPSMDSTLQTNVDYVIYARDRVRSSLFMNQQTGDQFLVFGQRVSRRLRLLTSSGDYYTNAGLFRIVDGKGTIE